MPAGGYGLFACRADRPAAALDAAGFDYRFNFNRCTVHFFLRGSLNFIGAHTVGKIKTAACGLGRGVPIGKIFLHDGFGSFFALTDFGTDQGNGLPALTTGVVDVGVVAAGRGVGFHAVQQLVSRGEIDFRRGAFGEVLDNIHLHIVIN